MHVFEGFCGQGLFLIAYLILAELLTCQMFLPSTL